MTNSALCLRFGDNIWGPRSPTINISYTIAVSKNSIASIRPSSYRFKFNVKRLWLVLVAARSTISGDRDKAHWCIVDSGSCSRSWPLDRGRPFDFVIVAIEWRNWWSRSRKWHEKTPLATIDTSSLSSMNQYWELWINAMNVAVVTSGKSQKSQFLQSWFNFKFQTRWKNRLVSIVTTTTTISTNKQKLAVTMGKK